MTYHPQTNPKEMRVLNIEHTREKLRQFGVELSKMKGNDNDRRRRLLVLCEKCKIAPVYDWEID